VQKSVPEPGLLYGKGIPGSLRGGVVFPVSDRVRRDAYHEKPTYTGRPEVSDRAKQEKQNFLTGKKPYSDQSSWDFTETGKQGV
jgi:hypothetical protein